jgi:hypothetical protein
MTCSVANRPGQKLTCYAFRVAFGDDDTYSGLALAALLWDDREMTGAAAALPHEVVERVRARLDAFERASRGEPDPGCRAMSPADRTSQTDRGSQRTEPLRALIAEVHGCVSGAGLPSRARALIARHVPKGQGRSLLAGAPPARAGYHAPEDLLTTILRLSRLPALVHPRAPEDAPSSTDPGEIDHVATTSPR